MRRRLVLTAGILSSLAIPLGLRRNDARADEPDGALTWRRFEITTDVTLLSSPSPARLWLPVAQEAAGYQVPLALQWQGNGEAQLVHDGRYGAGMLFASWSATAQGQHMRVVQTVATRDRGEAPSLLPLTAAERAFWMAHTETVPTDGIVRETAKRIVAGHDSPRARLRAIYDWVVDNTWRNPEAAGCGTGDFKTMLKTGKFGGKCADINGLMVGLARAAGFPARDVYGIRVADSRLFPSLGRSGNISKAQHCRAEVFLDDSGWFAVDPTDVRKVVLEDKRPIDSPEVRALRDRLFGSWEMNWVGYNSAVDVVLPHGDGSTPNFAFLMYPCALTAAGQPDCLDPPGFRYELTARELSA